MRGISARSVARRHKESAIEEQKKLSEGNEDTHYSIPDIHVAHDHWSARFHAGSFAGLGTSYMFTGIKKWELRNPLVGFIPMRQQSEDQEEGSEDSIVSVSKSAKASTLLYLRKLEEYGVFPDAILSSTSDTTGSAINVFKENENTVDVHRA